MSRSGSLSDPSAPSTRPNIETVIAEMAPNLATEAWLNERVCFTLAKTAEKLLLQKIAIGNAKLSTVTELRSFMLAVAPILDMKVPTMEDKELAGIAGVAFQQGDFQAYLTRFRRLPAPVINTILLSSMNKSSMNRKLSAVGHATEDAKHKAEEAKQDFTRFYHVSCSEQSYYIQEQTFTSEILREQSMTVIGQTIAMTRFASKEEADNFLTALKAEKICAEGAEVRADHSYRQKSRFVGQNVFSITFSMSDFERLGKYQVVENNKAAGNEEGKLDDPDAKSAPRHH